VPPPSRTSTPAALATVTATAIPSGDELLVRMQRAVRTAGSVRFVTRELSVRKKERVIVTTHADISWRRNMLREHDLTRTIELDRHPVVSTVDRRTLLVAHQMAASRSSLNHHWYCEQLRGVHVGDSFLPFEISTPSAINVGVTTVRGAAVWHVQATGVTVYSWALHAATVDFYIGQADNMLRVLDIHGTAKLAGKTIQESDVERYSRYGERATVRLPVVCRPTTHSRDRRR